MNKELWKRLPKYLIGYILLWSDSQIIIKLQNYFPYLLQYILIDIKFVNSNNIKYCKRLIIRELKYLDILIQIHNLIHLECYYTNIDDNMISKFTNLNILECYRCQYITDKSISCLINLSTFNCYGCQNITDKSISCLINLNTLNCYNCQNITDKSISCLINLNTLNCYDCQNITDKSISCLINLNTLNCYNC